MNLKEVFKPKHAVWSNTFDYSHVRPEQKILPTCAQTTDPWNLRDSKFALFVPTEVVEMCDMAAENECILLSSVTESLLLPCQIAESSTVCVYFSVAVLVLHM